jgi:hypothetical protein
LLPRHSLPLPLVRSTSSSLSSQLQRRDFASFVSRSGPPSRRHGEGKLDRQAAAGLTFCSGTRAHGRLARACRAHGETPLNPRPASTLSAAHRVCSNAFAEPLAGGSRLTSGSRRLSQDRCNRSNRTKFIAMRMHTSRCTSVLRKRNSVNGRRCGSKSIAAEKWPRNWDIKVSQYRSNPWPNALHSPPPAVCRSPTTKTASPLARAGPC